MEETILLLTFRKDVKVVLPMNDVVSMENEGLRNEQSIGDERGGAYVYR
jgi:hypothetical protein